jgi:hypothetical protein
MKIPSEEEIFMQTLLEKGVSVVMSVPAKRYVKNSLNRVIGNLKDVGKLRTRSKRNTPTQTNNT